MWFASGRRGVSSLTFRGQTVLGEYTGFTDRPAYANARDIAADLMTAYIDGEVDRVEIFYNRYISPLTQEVTRETLLPLQQATIFEGSADEESLGGRAGGEDEEERSDGPHALVEYEPDPEEILQRLVPAYVEISIYRALLESTASEHGARMTAMRNASENASDLIKDLTLQMNRERQAEITQEIMEVVAGAESLTYARRPEHGSQHQRQEGRAGVGERRAQRRPDRGDPGRRDRGRLPGQAARDQLGASTSSARPARAPKRTRTSARTSSARSSSTSATTASARSPWTPPTASPAAPR